MRLLIQMILCALVVLAGAGRCTAYAQPATLAPAGADWPQLGHDAQRSNATPAVVDGPYRFYWRMIGAPIASRVQPVVSANRLFVGSLNGTMYAIDADFDAKGGAPRILWQRDLGSPIRAGAAVAGDTVVVGIQHGRIYGLDAATGTIRWWVGTGGAILAAPLVDASTVYVGSADGMMRALQADTGQTRWNTDLGAPILGSAALSADGSTIFVAAENMLAFGLAASSGTVRWETALPGQSSSDRWPVVAGDTVIFRTMPVRYFHDLLHDGDQVLDHAGPVRADWAYDWNAVRPGIVDHLATHPADQTMVVLRATNGIPVGTAPVLYAFGTNDAPAPPVVANHHVYTVYRARHGIQTDSDTAVHVTTKYDAELGTLNLTSLDIAGLTSSDSFAYQFRLTSDEPAILTASGNTLLVDNWERLGGIRLDTGALVGIAQVAWDYPDCWVHCEANDSLLPFFESYPFPQQRAGEGNSRAGAVVAAGRIFWKASTSGLAALGPARPNDTVMAPQPIVMPATSTIHSAPVSSAQPEDAQLRMYVWSLPRQPGRMSNVLQSQVQAEVRQLVATDAHWMPFALERGFHGDGSWPPDTSKSPEPAIVHNSEVYWFDPGEQIVTLSRAYPYLDARLQRDVKRYLALEMNRFAPLDTLPYPPSPWLAEGQRRELYDTGDRSSWNSWPPPDVPVQTLYALWAYGYYTGDWDYLEARWDAIATLFEARRSSIDSYARIAGVIGYARIARQLGYQREAREAEQVAIDAMRSGLDFAAWAERADNLYPDPRDIRTGQRAQALWGLTPEVGAYLRDTNRAAVASYIQGVIGDEHGSYLWYITRLGTQAERGESSFHSPELAWSVFLTQAYVLGADQQQLRFWLDRAWAPADVWHIQKLVAAIEAG